MFAEGSGPVDEAADDGLQHPVTHEGAPSDPTDTNEKGDDKATVVQPSGDPVPTSQDTSSR